MRDSKNIYMFQRSWSQHIEIIEEIWSALKAADFHYADDMHVMPKLASLKAVYKLFCYKWMWFEFVVLTLD